MRGGPWMVGLCLALTLGACTKKKEPGPSSDADADADTDTDTDTDTDADTDTGDSGAPTTAQSMLDTTVYTDTSDADGRVFVTVDVGPGTTAFQVTGEVDPDYRVALEAVLDPDGVRVVDWRAWWNADYSLTYAFFGFDPVTAFNWPSREEDGPLDEGVWTVVLDVHDRNYTPIPSEDVTVTVATKNDPDDGAGVVSVQILWADGVDDDPDVVDAVEQAVERWRTIWADHGITLQESYRSTTLDPRLGFTYVGSDEVAAIPKPEGDVQLIIGELIRNERYTYGVSAGVPGTIQQTRNTYVVLSTLVHAGVDGAFDDNDIAIMAGTMAHEVGHYMGLFHPVEVGFDAWDALEDTVDCTTRGDCEAALGTNLMYPYSICDQDGCVTAEEMTADQEGVEHRYLGTL